MCNYDSFISILSDSCSVCVYINISKYYNFNYYNFTHCWIYIAILLTKQCISVCGSLGLVFLQYRNETKRALLPNEITSIDTVKALFVRSFPKQLTMEYLDSPHVKVYIHDSNKDMFYELEDLRYNILLRL